MADVYAERRGCDLIADRTAIVAKTKFRGLRRVGQGQLRPTNLPRLPKLLSGNLLR
jgi:hypothetical protein